VTAWDHRDPTQVQSSGGLIEALQGDLEKRRVQAAAMDKRLVQYATAAPNSAAALWSREHEVFCKALLVLKAKEKTVQWSYSFLIVLTLSVCCTFHLVFLNTTSTGKGEG
jgi:hypothetical protein